MDHSGKHLTAIEAERFHPSFSGGETGSEQSRAAPEATHCLVSQRDCAGPEGALHCPLEDERAVWAVRPGPVHAALGRTREQVSFLK